MQVVLSPSNGKREETDTGRRRGRGKKRGTRGGGGRRRETEVVQHAETEIQGTETASPEAAEEKRGRRRWKGDKSQVTVLPTHQIRPAMAKIRSLCTQQAIPFMSHHLDTVGMSVVDFCFLVTLQNHKKRTVNN